MAKKRRKRKSKAKKSVVGTLKACRKLLSSAISKAK